MLMQYYKCLCFIVLILARVSYADEYVQTIRIAAIDWCPQICIGEEKKGYVIELVAEVFRSTPYNITITYFPWSRGIKYVNEGEYHALLAPTKSEAPNLLFPKFPVGEQSMCFFSSKNNTWRYEGELSLEGLQIGIALDTSVEELNDYIQDNLDQFQFQPYHDRYVRQSVGKVNKGRIDAFLFTKNTTNHILNKFQIKDQIKESGCVSKASFYLAFTPEIKLESKTQSWLTAFDERMKLLIENGYVSGLHKRYGIK